MKRAHPKHSFFRRDILPRFIHISHNPVIVPIIPISLPNNKPNTYIYYIEENRVEDLINNLKMF